MTTFTEYFDCLKNPSNLETVIKATGWETTALFDWLCFSGSDLDQVVVASLVLSAQAWSPLETADKILLSDRPSEDQLDPRRLSSKRRPAACRLDTIAKSSWIFELIAV